MQYIAVYRSWVQFNVTGQWRLQIKTTTADSRSTWALINNVFVPINTTTQTGIFQVNATGEVCLQPSLPWVSSVFTSPGGHREGGQEPCPNQAGFPGTNSVATAPIDCNSTSIERD